MTTQDRALRDATGQDSGLFDGVALGSLGAVEEMCRNIGRLANLGDRAVRRVSMTVGPASVEVEWHADPTAPAGAAASTPGTGADAEERSGQAPVEGHEIRSPLVGTFYAAPEPGARPFVEVGQFVTAGQQVGIVEAMKLMNPVTADAEGQVLQILVDNGEAVEFDQPLLLLSPAEPE
ncbi:acetyl-CoA carboxylase biotin carboxyl carrier protein [Amycolatopsis arida]|uniref:Biotin carboxyl carrier protein of acetyl-CoA carboxylase n=1 Tax=Amycolatopsis arida TaxID=587909 RepID=A0A1I6A885_9PSEU|nr:acetyl-CoA carboxylase biotin carboxyl carrier protein [Amycolatopsis arida]TDX88532.1 acetyl-CoA carboxylase biotin carboxyl carrier protein [Amycolatopsis arida]SFQ64833.1 acetyl-CoA carboxylase biotin carboxyl carrier protein [Amycolatopsis arida]